MGLPKDFHKLDLYGILGIPDDADEKQIAKSYRKKALKCHPDKNPDNPKAAEEFHKLSLALEILTDLTARAAYDKVIQSKKATRKRHQELDSRRKKFKEDLEARERAGSDQRQSDTDAETRLQNEIERLRREGSRLVEEQQRLVREEMQWEAQSQTKRGQTGACIVTPKVKVTWNGKAPFTDSYNEDILRQIFSKHGEVSNVLMSSKKGRALVEFDRLDSMNVTDERGNIENPLKVKWLEGKSTAEGSSDSAHNSPRTTIHPHDTVNAEVLSSQSSGGGQNDANNDRDFESLVMRRLRQAEERRKLIEDIAKQEAEET